MVKGTTRQVIVVNGTDKAVFDQAIFLVRDDVISNGGVTEDAILKQARQACQTASPPPAWRNILWSAFGAGAVGLLWLLTALL